MLVRGRDEPRCWYFPGGGIDAYEMPYEAARREVLEETGVRTRNRGLFIGVENGHLYFATTTLTPNEVAVLVDAENEIIDAKFFDPATAINKLREQPDTAISRVSLVMLQRALDLR